VPVTICPINRLNLPFYRRESEDGSTEFTYSRFLTPFLSRYEGVSLFLDSDMVVLDDIANLFALYDDQYAVQCVQHDYVPSTDTKFLGNKQVNYPRKNWSSVMLFNNAKCRALTPERVAESSGAYLHRMYWAEDNIGQLPLRWNYLVGEYEKIPVSDISLLHYTLGTCCFKEYENCDYSEQWHAEFQKMTYAYSGLREAIA
jgi:lipopolysaccharide biosynthesis glycosyltransferase